MCVIVTTTRPSLFTPVQGQETHPDATSFYVEDDGRLVLNGPGDDRPEVSVYSPGSWVSARVVGEHELELQVRVRELEEELEQARAAAVVDEVEFDAFLDATGAAGQEGEQYLAHVDDRLLFLLNVAGREWGPMGVALAAARMSDPRAVRRALKPTES